MQSRVTKLDLLRSLRTPMCAVFGMVCLAVVVYSKHWQPVAEAADQPSKPPMFVLQVGIGKYLDAPTWTDLRGTATDVDEMRKLLESERFQVPAENIVTLKDSQGTKKRIFAAFQENLIATAKERFEKTKRRDTVVLFQYSGHGSQVPDVDGDEDDKLDETLVTYDSKDVKGKNFDITDDEIFALTAELKKYTDNIVYIFDSCHSGSGTRNAEDARRLPARTTVPEAVPLPGIATRSGSAGDDGSNGVLPPGSDYIVISAAQADQIATQKYCFEECGRDKDPVVYGLLTYYLLEELRNARNDTSYREVMENVVRKVTSEKPSQTPLIEGDERLAVFGSRGRAEDNFAQIVRVEPDAFRIRSGAIQGVSVGSIVAVYDKSVARFDNADKIATGRVVATNALESTVKLFNPKRPITENDKAVVASTDLGIARSRLLLEGIDSNATSDMKAIAAILRTSFESKNGVADARGIDVVPATSLNRQTGRWNIALLKDKYSRVFPSALRGGGIAPNCYESGASQASPEREVYYLAGPDYVPLFGFCIEAPTKDEASVTLVADRIEKSLSHIARYRSVQTVQNRQSRLAGKVVVKPVRLTNTSGTFSGPKNCVDGKFVADKYEPISKNTDGKYVFGPGDVFWFEVTNNSPFDLYISMLNLRSNGSIKLLFPRNIAGESDGVVIPKNGGRRVVNSDRCRLDANGGFIEAGAFRTGIDPGIDSFKFIATANPMKWSDLAYLEMDALKRNENATLVTNSEWIAVDLTFEIK